MAFLPDGDNEQGKKSVLRSIRVSTRLAANLEREARERRIPLDEIEPAEAAPKGGSRVPTIPR